MKYILFSREESKSHAIYCLFMNVTII
jgi:hypothetical protein